MINIDHTPNNEYAIRILQEYLNLTYEMYSNMVNGENEDELCEKLNEDQLKRRKILENAINILKLNTYIQHVPDYEVINKQAVAYKPEESKNYSYDKENNVWIEIKK